MAFYCDLHNYCIGANNFCPYCVRAGKGNIRVGTVDASSNLPCGHKNGWYYTVISRTFLRKYLGCSDCGEQIPQTKWRGI
jgi:hypothetical protein